MASLLRGWRLRRYNCVFCPAGSRAVREVAEDVLHQLGQEEPIFFLSVDIDGGREAFAAHDLQMAPVVVFHPSTTRSRSISLQQLDSNPIPLEPERTLQPESSDDGGAVMFGPEAILRLLHRHGRASHVRLSWKPSQWRTPALCAAGFMGLLIALVRRKQAAPALDQPEEGGSPHARSVNVLLWILSTAVYFVAVSGVIYCIIRTPPFSGSQNGVPTIMSSSASGQYVSEGLFLGVLNLVAAACIIILILVGQRSRSELALAVIGIVAVALFVTVYARIVHLYAAKSGWYSVADLVPSDWLAMANRMWTVARRFGTRMTRDVTEFW